MSMLGGRGQTVKLNISQLRAAHCYHIAEGLVAAEWRGIRRAIRGRSPSELHFQGSTVFWGAEEEENAAIPHSQIPAFSECY